jgi:hypothetical protein
MPAPVPHRNGIVDLVAIGAAAQPLAAWWRRLLELGQPGLHRLDEARQALTALGPIPGRLGRAIDLIVACDTATPDTEMAAAIAMLVELADRLPPSPTDTLPSSPTTAPLALTLPPTPPVSCRPVPLSARSGEQMRLPLDQQSAS